MAGQKTVLAVFKENPERKGIFDLAKQVELPFHYFKLEKPRRKYLKRRNVKAVIQSWDNFGAKILHTGLIPVQKDWYFGDNFGEETRTRKDFIVAHFRRTPGGKKAILVFYFIGVVPLDKVGATREVLAEWMRMEKVKAAR